MISEIDKKALAGISLTELEINALFNYFCTNIRKKYGMIDPMDADCKVCFETATEFARIMLIKYGFNIFTLSVKEKLDIPLTHYFNVVFMNVDGKSKMYLVDMTYSQFFGKKIILDDGTDGKKFTSTKNVFEDLKDESFIKNLRQNGFVEVSEETLKKYIDAFLNFCRVKDKHLAYDSINKSLSRQVLSEDSLSSKITILKKIKDGLLDSNTIVDDEKIK